MESPESKERARRGRCGEMTLEKRHEEVSQVFPTFSGRPSLLNASTARVSGLSSMDSPSSSGRDVEAPGSPVAGWRDCGAPQDFRTHYLTDGCVVNGLNTFGLRVVECRSHQCSLQLQIRTCLVQEHWTFGWTRPRQTSASPPSGLYG